MRVLGWDFGSRWAWCSADTDKPPEQWRWGGGTVGAGHLGERMLKFEGEALDVILGERPDAMSYEEVLSARGRGATIILPQTGIVSVEAERLGLFMAGINPRTLKHFATGNGNAKKPDMLGALVDRPEWHFLDQHSINDDEVDAIWVAIWALETWEVEDG